MSGVNSYSKIFDLSSWKDRVALRWESLGRAVLKEMINSSVLGKFVILVDLQMWVFSIVLWFFKIEILKQCIHCSGNVTFVKLLIFNMFNPGKT